VVARVSFSCPSSSGGWGGEVKKARSARHACRDVRIVGSGRRWPGQPPSGRLVQHRGGERHFGCGHRAAYSRTASGGGPNHGGVLRGGGVWQTTSRVKRGLMTDWSLQSFLALETVGSNERCPSLSGQG
jgi:hypothetical protein